jgi:hypothetical protein
MGVMIQRRMGRGVRGIHGHPIFEISYVSREKKLLLVGEKWRNIIGRKEERREWEERRDRKKRREKKKKGK